jgi:hypothetical protein
MVKLVKESLEQRFTRGSDNKISSLNIGLRVQIIKWLEDEKITHWKINDDNTIDVACEVDFSTSHETKNFPKYIQFNSIEGFFDCSFRKMTSLKGCPRYVLGYFSCTHNDLDYDSIEDFPKHVMSTIYVGNNKFSPEDILILKDKYPNSNVDGENLQNKETFGW